MKKQRGFMALVNSEKAIWILVALALLERIIMFFYIGSGELHNSDDVAYVQSGIVFAQTGVISVWNPMPTAKIMPAMPVVTGLLSMLFGEGEAYINSIRILWIILGCVTVWVMYKCCCVILPRPYALFAASAFLLPNWAWSDNAVLTETPYLLFYMLCFYGVLRLGENEGERDRGAIALFVLGFMAALMFRPNILIFLPFAAAYLLLVKRKKLSQLIRPALCLAVAMLMFVVPWSIRNYRLFGEFIPITSGSSNPTLLGTYQGESAPADESLDYETNVFRVVREEFPDWFDENGNLLEGEGKEIVIDRMERLKTSYRLKTWFERDPLGLIWTYLASKPACMLNWVWIWLPAPQLYYALQFVSRVNLLLCGLTAIYSIFTKKMRPMVLWLGFTYVLNIFFIALSFASERYAAMFMPLRYIIASIGLYLAVDFIKSRRMKSIREK